MASPYRHVADKFAGAPGPRSGAKLGLAGWSYSAVQTSAVATEGTCGHSSLSSQSRAHLSGYLQNEATAKDQTVQVSSWQSSRKMQPPKPSLLGGQQLIASSTNGLFVVGCTNISTGKIIEGAYFPFTTNHGKTVYKKGEQVNGISVYVYFWDHRDGPTFCGWWFGPKVGGDEVWAYNGEDVLVPPSSGWQVPYGGPVDTTLRVSTRRIDSAGKLSQMDQTQPWAKDDPTADTIFEEAGSQAERVLQQTCNMKAQNAASAMTALIQRLQSAAPKDVDKVKKEPESLRQELPNCGPHAQEIRKEADIQIEQARWRIEKTSEQQHESESCRPGVEQMPEKQLSDPVAPCLVQVPQCAVVRLVGNGGSGLKRLMESTGCSIVLPEQRLSSMTDSAPVGVKLNGGAKQRRLAAEAIRQVIDGGDPEDVVARSAGAVVLTHDLEHAGSREWIAWRLMHVEYEYGVQLRLCKKTAQLWANNGVALPSTVLEQVLGAARAAIDEAQALAELTVHVPCDLKLEASDFEVTISPLMDNYGVLIRMLEPQRDMVPVHVLGPPEAARDAAALLWTRFVQGKSVASVLQVMGQVQGMSKEMAGDFEHDLQKLEAEYKVRVHQVDTMLWIEGDEPKSVVFARSILQEIMQFYLPEKFFWVRGLELSVIDTLRGSKDFRSLTAKRDCAVVLELEGKEGTAWICGKDHKSVQQLIKTNSKL